MRCIRLPRHTESVNAPQHVSQIERYTMSAFAGTTNTRSQQEKLLRSECEREESVPDLTCENEKRLTYG